MVSMNLLETGAKWEKEPAEIVMDHVKANWDGTGITPVADNIDFGTKDREVQAMNMITFREMPTDKKSGALGGGVQTYVKFIRVEIWAEGDDAGTRLFNMAERVEELIDIDQDALASKGISWMVIGDGERVVTDAPNKMQEGLSADSTTVELYRYMLELHYQKVRSA